MADLSWMKKRNRAEMCDCSLHGNQELAWMGRKPCHSASFPVYTLKRLGPRLPVGMLQMSLLAFQWVGRGKKTTKKNRTCQPGRDEHETRGAFRLAPGSRTNRPRPLSSALIWQSTLMPPNSARVMTERQLHIGLYQTSPTFLTTFFASPSEIREGVITDGIRDVLWREKQKTKKKIQKERVE